MRSFGQDKAVCREIFNISTDKATLQDQKQKCGCMWCDGGGMSLQNAYMCEKVAVTCLFKRCSFVQLLPGERQCERECEQKRKAESTTVGSTGYLR